jgi:uncharacterized membrane-anchored protein
MKLKLLILVLALQCAWIGYTVATQEYGLASGKLVMLETRRVDPRDLLRGDYLILNYKISDVPTNLFAPPVQGDLSPGTKVFVALAPGTNDFYEVTRASTAEFPPAEGEVLLAGKSTDRWWGGAGSVQVTYGIEKYFIAEGTGNPVGKLTVQVAVPKSGRAGIKQVFVDGKPYAQAMRDKAR